MFEDFFDTWEDGFSYLFSDDLTSFYTFFTFIFAECIYLKVFYTSVAIPLIIILLGYIVNIIVSSWLIGNYEFTDKGKKYSIIYAIVFASLFLIGCFINLKLIIIMTAFPLIYTKLAIKLREFQDTCYSLTKYIGIFLLIVFEFLIVGLPFIAFTLSIVNTSLPILLKVSIPILYFAFMPFIAYLEDVLAAENIFELFDIL